MSCIPLSKHLPNLINVPLISSFVQSSIDAALAEHVIPKSLTLDLRDMLVGDDFKKETVTRGIILVLVKEAKDFKEGDGGVGPMEGSSDAYVTCSLGKFGKTISSTRIIVKINLQLWDSDKCTADDDLGRVEVDLKELMHSSKTKNQMHNREDRFRDQDSSEHMPGTFSWSVGYYSMRRLGSTKTSLRNRLRMTRSRPRTM